MKAPLCEHQQGTHGIKTDMDEHRPLHGDVSPMGSMGQTRMEALLQWDVFPP